MHFVLAAIAIFAFYEFLERYNDRAARTIVVTSADMERIAALYSAETGTLPPPDDMRAMVGDYVRQEVLVREARKLGLQEDDTVINRRLAQKMEFMVADLAAVESPDNAELEDWYNTNSDRFRTPSRISFQHVFLSGDTTDDPDQLLMQLNAPGASDWKKLGDPFMLQRQYGSLPYREAVRIFGRVFADALFSMTVETGWQGPIDSAFGRHIIQIQERSEESLPAFEDVRPAVLKDWREHQRRQANTSAISDLIGNYEVIIEGADK